LGHSVYLLESMFILSLADLLLNAASYGGEILHGNARRPYAGNVMCFMSLWVVVTKIMTFFQKCVHVRLGFAAVMGPSAGWLAADKACAINSVTIIGTGLGCSRLAVTWQATCVTYFQQTEVSVFTIQLEPFRSRFKPPPHAVGTGYKR